MTRSSIVTEKSVWKAAEKLLSEGFDLSDITNTMIKKELGGGSMSTITPLVRDWKSAKLESRGLAFEMPADFKNFIQDSGAQAWRIAVAQANSAFETKFEETRRNMRNFQELENEIDAIEANLTHATNTIQTVFAQLAEIQNIIIASLSELAVYQKAGDFQKHTEVSHAKIHEIQGYITKIVSINFHSQVMPASAN